MRRADGALVLCVALVPHFGGHGAAAATSIALIVETVVLFVVTLCLNIIALTVVRRYREQYD